MASFDWLLIYNGPIERQKLIRRNMQSFSEWNDFWHESYPWFDRWPTDLQSVELKFSAISFHDSFVEYKHSLRWGYSFTCMCWDNIVGKTYNTGKMKPPIACTNDQDKNPDNSFPYCSRGRWWNEPNSTIISLWPKSVQCVSCWVFLNHFRNELRWQPIDQWTAP